MKLSRLDDANASVEVFEQVDANKMMEDQRKMDLELDNSNLEISHQDVEIQ